MKWILPAILILAGSVNSNEFRQMGEVSLKILPVQDKDQIWLQPYVAGANGFKKISGPWPPERPCEGVWKWGYEIDGNSRHIVIKCGTTILEMNNFMF